MARVLNVQKPDQKGLSLYFQGRIMLYCCLKKQLSVYMVFSCPSNEKPALSSSSAGLMRGWSPSLQDWRERARSWQAMKRQEQREYWECDQEVMMNSMD